MSPPAWQRAVVAVQQRADPVLRAAVDREDVAGLIAAAQQARRGVVRAAAAPSRRLLHLANLPAASDVNRLLVQIAALEREVREVRKQLEDAGPRPVEPWRTGDAPDHIPDERPHERTGGRAERDAT